MAAKKRKYKRDDLGRFISSNTNTGPGDRLRIESRSNTGSKSSNKVTRLGPAQETQLRFRNGKVVGRRSTGR